jgi:hypothetical protein
MENRLLHRLEFVGSEDGNSLGEDFLKLLAVVFAGLDRFDEKLYLVPVAAERLVLDLLANVLEFSPCRHEIVFYDGLYVDVASAIGFSSRDASEYEYADEVVPLYFHGSFDKRSHWFPELFLRDFEKWVIGFSDFFLINSDERAPAVPLFLYEIEAVEYLNGVIYRFSAVVSGLPEFRYCELSVWVSV